VLILLENQVSERVESGSEGGEERRAPRETDTARAVTVIARGRAPLTGQRASRRQIHHRPTTKTNIARPAGQPPPWQFIN